MTDKVAPTASVLLACNKLLVRDVSAENEAFLICKSKNRDPAACEKEAIAVTRATIRTYDAYLHILSFIYVSSVQKAQQDCPKEFKGFTECVEQHHDFDKCRAEQEAFERCTKLWYGFDSYGLMCFDCTQGPSEKINHGRTFGIIYLFLLPRKSNILVYPYSYFSGVRWQFCVLNTQLHSGMDPFPIDLELGGFNFFILEQLQLFVQ